MNCTCRLTQIALLVGSLLVMLNSHASITPNPIKVSLQYSIDRNCDGNSANTEEFAIPGACIIYTITATNSGDTPAFNLLISGKIPEHTRLYSSPNLSNNKLLRGTKLVKNHKSGETMIQNHINQLDPGEENSILMQYTVRIL